MRHYMYCKFCDRYPEQKLIYRKTSFVDNKPSAVLTKHTCTSCGKTQITKQKGQ